MKNEQINVPKSQCKRSEISDRELVRLVVKSDLYSSQFFQQLPSLLGN
ncbi:hypothetical protein [Nostoc sphaeroides]|nr:hypothetical protein [Nostoc sphaeroides]